MSECRNCGSKLPSFSFGELSYLCRKCRHEREEQQKRFAATNEYDFFIETLGPHKATIGLIAVNVIVFAAMLYGGVDPVSPETKDLIARGADYGPKTLGEHQYWRLITNSFVHIGLMHIALNAICLWSFGRKLEEFFGAVTTISVYLLTAVGGSILSLSWDPYRVSAGASGAVFGIAGCLIAFLYYGKHDLTAHERTAELSNVVKFSLINLMLGLRAHTDNMAHLGGLVTGVTLGWFLSRRDREQQKLFPTFQVAGTAAALLAIVMTVSHAKAPDMAFMRAVDVSHSKNFKEAIKQLSEYVKNYPKRAEGHALLGYCYDSDEQYDAAIREYEAALKLDPSIEYVQADLGHLYVTKQRFKEAIPLLEPVLDHPEKDEVELITDYAAALSAVGRHSDAEAALRKALESDKDNVGLHSSLAVELAAEGKRVEAEKESYITKNLEGEQKQKDANDSTAASSSRK